MDTLPANVRVIKSAKCIDGRATQYVIRGGKGLMLEVFSSGARRWIVRYRLRVEGQRKDRRYVIGDPERIDLGHAIETADQVLRAVANGQDPFAERKAKQDGVEPTETFGALFVEWLEKHAKPNLATWSDEARRYRLHLEASLGRKGLNSITRADIAKIRDQLFESGTRIESNRVVALFNRVMNYGVDEQHVTVNPGARMRKLGAERPRTRVLTPDMLRTLWNGLESAPISPTMALAIQLTILTGQRRTEVIGAMRSEFDFAEKTWIIPSRRVDGDPTSGGTKNKVPQLIPLAPKAQSVVHTAIEAAGNSPFLFPSPKTGAAMRGDAMTTALRRSCQALDMAQISPHDLRRTINTEMAKLGVPKDHRKLILNHSDAKGDTITTHYDVHDYIPEKLAALVVWEDRITAIVDT